MHLELNRFVVSRVDCLLNLTAKVMHDYTGIFRDTQTDTYYVLIQFDNPLFISISIWDTCSGFPHNIIKSCTY